MNRDTLIGTDIGVAAEWLRRGELVAIPTETVYGLAGNALDEEAVVRIFETKERPLYNPLIVHVDSEATAADLVTGIDEPTGRLMAAFWPGPLTLLLPRNERVPDLVCAGLDRVAIRMPDHPLTLRLIAECGFPLAAPSANLFGRISPTTPQHVADQLDSRIPYILDGGPCQVGVESTILGQEDSHWVIYRAGGITEKDLEPYTGPLRKPGLTTSPDAPGMLPWHYAPLTPLVIGEPQAGTSFGALRFREYSPVLPESRQYLLAPDGDLHTAARRLYAGLHKLDALGLDRIFAQPVPDDGIGRAINDRLGRAAAAR